MIRLFASFLLISLMSSAAIALDHSYRALQDSVLAPFVTAEGVDYATLSAQSAPLDHFLNACTAVSFEDYQKFSRAQQMAFLINLYNAAVLKLVCLNWPAESIRDTGGIFTSPWNKRFIRIFGRTVGLGQIQHDILRPQFADIRVHFTLCNASQSSPPLRAEPYLPERLDQQLEEQTAHYMTARPELNRLENGTLYLSKLIYWYSPDFGKTDGVRNFATRYFPGINAQTKISYSDFDWTLNRKP